MTNYMALLRSKPSLFILTVACVGLCCAQRPEAVEQSDNPRSLRSRATKARAERRAILDLGTTEGIPPIVASLEDASRVYSVIIGVPVSQETVIENDRHLPTGHKLHVIERLSRRPASVLVPNLSEFPAGERPESQIPEGSEMIFLIQHGGTLTINGLTITERVAGFPQLIKGKKYLFILDTSADSKISTSPLGGAGVFEISDVDSLIPLAQSEHPLASEIRGKDANSLTGVRRAIAATRILQ